MKIKLWERVRKLDEKSKRHKFQKNDVLTRE